MNGLCPCWPKKRPFVGSPCLDSTADEACAVGWVYLFTYVYVVAVNKGATNLCTTAVYSCKSTSWRTHNSCAACVGSRGCAEQLSPGFGSMPSCPECVHIARTRISLEFHRLIHKYRWISWRDGPDSRPIIRLACADVYSCSSEPWRSARNRYRAGSSASARSRSTGQGSPSSWDATSSAPSDAQTSPREPKAKLP